MSVIKKINITDPTTHVTTLNPIGALAGDVDYDNTTSGLQADDVQEALDEIAANMGEGTAADTTYDNTESGLSADNVQDAIDEIDLTVDSLSASVLSINNDIDEIELSIDDLSSSIVTINNNINNINDNINEIELTIDQLSSSVLSIKDDVQELELTIDNLSASTLDYDNTTSGLTADDVQGAIDELASQDSGHTYKNDSGTSMTQRSNAQFKGVYIEDDSTNNATNINIVREFQNDAEVQALTGEAAKGFQHTPDNVYRARSAADITFDPTNTLLTSNRVQEALEELDAEHLPYSSTQSTKQKIDELDESIGEWSDGELLYSETWGGLYGSYNEKCKLAVLRWYGNSTSATAGTKTYSLSGHYKPAFFMVSPMLNSTSMEVNPSTEQISMQLTANNWVSGSIIYPTK